MNGTWYFSSREIHRDHCLKTEKRNKADEGETLYYHDVLVAAMVKPESSIVLPLNPGFIRNEDGQVNGIETADVEGHGSIIFF